MNESIVKLRLEIEKAIVRANKLMNESHVIASLKESSNLFNSKHILSMSKKDFDKIIKNLKKPNQLTENEEEFIKSLIRMPDEIKQIKEILGFGTEQVTIIENIHSKIEKRISSFSEVDVLELEKKVNEYKVLLNKLDKNDFNLITEIDLIAGILEKSKLSFEEKINILKGINQINASIAAKYNISFTSSEENIISEDSLEETNLPLSLLQDLFTEFAIRWEIEDTATMSERAKTQKKNKLAQLQNKLLKYGNYEQMREKLQILKDHHLDFVFSMFEILTRILLFTKKEQLFQLIESANKTGIDLTTLVRKQPTVLFPQIKERKNKGKKSPSSSERTFYGGWDNCINNIKFLEENGYSVFQVFEDCPTFFILNNKTIRKNQKYLQMYGFSLKDEEGKTKHGFSMLGRGNLLKQADIAIENGCYQYFYKNLSRFASDINVYRIKLARSKGLDDSKIFRLFNGTKRNGICLRAEFYNPTSEQFGDMPSDTFDKYQAVEPYVESKEIYDQIIANSDNDNISEIATSDSVIDQLDKLYKDPNNDLVYNFNGIIISRLKVLRYYQTLMMNSKITSSKELLIYVITKHSMLNMEELSTIKQCIREIKFGEKVKL